MAIARHPLERQDLGRIALRADRCVHEHAAVATCRACLDVCPAGAWLLDDDQLALDTASCDGCGLCAGSCPTGALEGATLGQLVANRPLAEPVLDLACERAVPAGLATLPCLHATNPRELAALHRRGVRRLEVCAAPCDDGDETSCPRSGRSPTLEAMLATANALLAEVGEPPLRLVRRPSAEWARATAQRRAERTLPNAGRRALFRRLGAAAEPPVAQPATEDAYAALVARLSPAAPHPLVPSIDAEHCVACHACARLCPTGALTLGQDAAGLHYRMAPERCTGCHLCQDCCEHGAVIVQRSSPWRQVTVPLAEHRCIACGVVFHVPADTTAAAGIEPGQARCGICRLAPVSRRLYQVQA
jgi:ferredoxin